MGVALAILLGAAGCGEREDATTAGDARRSPSRDDAAKPFEREVISEEMEARFSEVVLDPRDTPLAVGARAPALDGAPIERKSVIVFLRGVWCPPCRRQLGELQDRMREIEDRGATLVVISGDETAAFDAVRARMGLTCRFVSDPKLELAAKYGVRQQGDRFQLPSVFVVDAAGVVRFVQVAQNTSDRAPIDDILAALDASTVGGAPASPTAIAAGPSSRPGSAVAPDASESLRLFAELGASPAPSWVKAGTRLTYATTTTPIAGVDVGLRLDEGGAWVGADGQRLAVGGPDDLRGLLQVDVVALTGANAVLSVASWGRPSEEGPPRLSETAIVGVPGAGGDYWISPTALRRTDRAVPADVRFERRPYEARARRHDALWIASGRDAVSRLAVYDLESGVLLHLASTMPAVAPRAGDPDPSPRGGRALTSSTLVNVRDAAPPWAGARPPDWLAMFRWTDYVGEETTATPGGAAATLARARHLAVDARGPGWVRLHAEDQPTTSGDAPPSPRRSAHACGPAQYFGLYVPPSALVELRPGQELDRDPETKFAIRVGSATRVDGHDVVEILGENAMFRVEVAYGRTNGMRVHATTDDRSRGQRVDWRLGR